MRIQARRYQGLPAYELSDDAVELVVIPDWGGKLASVVDRRRQREWLYRNPALPYRLPGYDASYVQGFDVGGFDECFPNVATGAYPAAPWLDVPLPDHGEIWALPWQATPLADGLHMAVHGVRLPYCFEKTVRLPGNGRIRLEYRVLNPAPAALRFVWSSHPLLSVYPGMAISLPAQAVVVDHRQGGFPAPAGAEIPWPHCQGLDLSRLPAAKTRLAVKLFSRQLTAGWAALADPADGATLRFDFDPTQVTHVGLWLNYGGWAGVPGAAPYYNVALEPCIGASDRLDRAMAGGTHGQVPAEGSREWWLEISLS